MSTDTRSIEWYNANADNYTQHVRTPENSIYHSLYEKPAMYGLLPDLAGKQVLSLGCGSGEDCNYMQQQGVEKVTGVDISEKMIANARSAYPTCSFEVMDMEQLRFEDASFDFAYSSLAIHYIEDWTKVMQEAYRVLKPGSFFLFSCNHPMYSAMETVSDESNTKRKELSRVRTFNPNSVSITGDYVSRKALIAQGDSDMRVTTWHKSIGEICAEATQAGFLIANFVEPQPLPKMKEVSPVDYETLSKIPNFAIFKLLKPLGEPPVM